ncbi:Protein of unknown function [Pyronema omphalodes CBS 100304]|uniref:Uncharacterized protein n=1 Tax=Pyronema omphalodes (strain CBS 100304) TaxID=1076935 RepID=U4LV08_PYROM|nr:Protein of unknown function [Pyronema omphalodes CBS 100304]
MFQLSTRQCASDYAFAA